MARILLLVIIGFLVYLLFRGFMRLNRKDDPPAAPPATTDKGEDMVACARCGVNMPRSEARVEGGKLYCSNNPNCRP
jgi:uncharacterized protein